VNQLTLTAVDPQSRQPSYKHCAVQVMALAASEKRSRSRSGH
jgi:hypothetical protein